MRWFKSIRRFIRLSKLSMIQLCVQMCQVTSQVSRVTPLLSIYLTIEDDLQLREVSRSFTSALLRSLLSIEKLRLSLYLTIGVEIARLINSLLKRNSKFLPIFSCTKFIMEKEVPMITLLWQKIITTSRFRLLLTKITKYWPDHLTTQFFMQTFHWLGLMTFLSHAKSTVTFSGQMRRDPQLSFLKLNKET